MAINGLGSFDMMSNYNRIDYRDRASDLATSLNQEVKKAEPVKPVEPVKEEKTTQLKVNLNLDGMRRRPSFGIDDFSRDFNRKEIFSNSASDDQAMKYDMQKAVSDMEKDASLMQYQYFVGENSIVVDNEDGIVVRK